LIIINTSLKILNLIYNLVNWNILNETSVLININIIDSAASTPTYHRWLPTPWLYVLRWNLVILIDQQQKARYCGFLLI